MTFWIVMPAENFQEQQNIWKGTPGFLGGMVPNLSSVSSKPSLIPISDFRGHFSVIQGQNLPGLNFFYHLTRPWRDRFAHFDGYKTLLQSQNLPTLLKLFQGTRSAMSVLPSLPRSCFLSSHAMLFRNKQQLTFNHIPLQFFYQPTEMASHVSAYWHVSFWTEWAPVIQLRQMGRVLFCSRKRWIKDKSFPWRKLESTLCTEIDDLDGYNACW